MVSQETVQRRYRSYVDDYPENTKLAFETDINTEYPIQERALGGDTFSAIYQNQMANESEYLFELDESVPAIHELPVELMPKVATELNRVLFVQITHDHLSFWSYTREVFTHPDSVNSEIPDHVADLLSSVLKMIQPEPEVGREGLNDESKGCYLGYPLLEAIAKWFASEYIELDGTLKTGQEIRKLGGGSYGPPEATGESIRCSDIGSLLFHVETEIAGEKLTENLMTTRGHIGDLYRVSSERVYGDVIKSNRNAALHGELEAPAEIGIILNLVSLLLWSDYVY